MSPSQRLGAAGEALAVSALERRGYTILATNVRTPLGEIDIVARDGEAIVFVEVKARRSRLRGDPKAAVTPLKQRRLSLAALAYLKRTRQSGVRARFDVVAITGGCRPPQIEIVRNAFELCAG